MLDLHPDLFTAISRITANHISSIENEWCLRFRDELFRESEIAACGLGFNINILYTEVAEQSLFKYHCFKSTDIIIQSMGDIENLSAWRFLGLDWSDDYNTQYLKKASSLMVSYFEIPERFPQKKDKIIELIELLLKYKCGYELRDIEGQYVKFKHDLNDFYCTDNMKKVKWYDLDYIVTLPEAKDLIPLDVLNSFIYQELSFQLTITIFP